MTGYLNWIGGGNPGFKSIIESMTGSTYANGHARYDFFNSRLGYADAKSGAGIGVKVIGTTVGGISESEFQASESTAGVKTEDNNGNNISMIGFSQGYTFSWPPSYSTSVEFEFVDSDPLQELTEYFLAPVVTHAGYYDTWAIYWTLRGPTSTLKVRGREYYGHDSYGSWARTGVNTNFTPDLTQ